MSWKASSGLEVEKIVNNEGVRPSPNSLESFRKSPYASVKISSYFEVYDSLFSPYANKTITFVEVGVLHGGSLFMWRNFFGEKARIIGIDSNPAAKKWIDSGFEIFIGDQADPNFWNSFFSKVGKVHILLDDGGHTNLGQMQTFVSSMENIHPGGLIVIEDTHASYMREFGNPSKYSFISFAKSLIDLVNSRMEGIESKNSNKGKLVQSIHFYESIVAFSINASPSDSFVMFNEGNRDLAEDFRYDSYTSWWKKSFAKFYFLIEKPPRRVGGTNQIWRFLNPFLTKFPINVPWRGVRFILLLILLPIRKLNFISDNIRIRRLTKLF